MTTQRPASIIGQSPPLLAVLDHVSRLGRLNRPVLVIGERGTGKELIAERLHFLSERWDQPFLKLNCAALPEDLLESEMFGYEAGAFTGATRRHHGRFERADGGSLFLDEIASMSTRLQEKLLRVIEYGEFERLGGSETLRGDVRIIGAANTDLPALARSGRFREDLLDRLAFDVVNLPPLRARREDIPTLAEHFAVNMVKELQRDYFPGFTPAVLQSLANHPWPGNVRELRNVVERAVYHTPPDSEIDAVDFDPFASPYRPAATTAVPVAAESTPPARPGDNLAAAATPALPYDFKQHVQDLETRLLREALRSNRYHQRHTAESLGLTYHQLRGYLRKYDLVGEGQDGIASPD